MEFHTDSRASRSRRRNVAPVLLKCAAVAGLLLLVLLAIYGASFA